MSQHNTLILEVKKMDGSYRLVEDLRAVNQRTKTQFPTISNPYTLLNTISPKDMWYSVIDLKDAFWTCPLAEDSRDYFAFQWEDPETNRKQQLRWTSLPQGFIDSPNLFGQALQQWIEGYSEKVKFLYEKLTTDRIKWTEKDEGKFRRVNGALTVAPVLSLPDVREPFQLFVDVSNHTARDRIREDLEEEELDEGEKWFVDGSSRVIDGKRMSGYEVVDGQTGKVIEAEGKTTALMMVSTPEIKGIEVSDNPPQPSSKKIESYEKIGGKLEEDKLTHWVEAFPSPRATAQTVSRKLLGEIVPQNGVVNYIDSDQRTHFTLKIIKQMAEALGIRMGQRPKGLCTQCLEEELELTDHILTLATNLGIIELDSQEWFPIFQNRVRGKLRSKVEVLNVECPKSIKVLCSSDAIKVSRWGAFKMSPIIGSGFAFDNLKNPDDSTFAGLERSKLRFFDISQGCIFYSLIFQSLGNLESLNLFKNKINQIQRAFFCLGNLKILNLSSNLWGELCNYTFAGLCSVTYIDLQQNRIGMIGDKSFRHLVNLKIIYLDNAIKSLPSFPHLTSAFLGDNKLISVGNRAIIATHLELERNWLAKLGDLNVLFQIPDLQYIFLKQNWFSYRVKSANLIESNQLVYMDLGENMLLVWERDLCLDVFGALPKLQVLHLNNNYLSALPKEIFRGLPSLKRLYLASNLLSHLSPGLFPQSLTNLNLSGNQVFSPEPEVFMTLSVLDIAHNNYVCDCALKSLLLWLNETNVTLAGSQSDRYCVPPAFEGILLPYMTYDGCDEDELLQTLRFSLFIFFLVILLVFLVAVTIFIRPRGICFLWYKTTTKRLRDNQLRAVDKNEYKYDAYLCYSKNDFEWVQNSFLKHLDSQYFDNNRFTLCFERDFMPGKEHIKNINDAINSRKTICIVTRQFLKDGWCVKAFNFSQSRYFCDLKDVLIMVVVGSLSQYQLKKHKPINFLQRNRYLR
ncbi:LOW QUALITY PROTEIN: toll-like receptor 5 [Ammospiza maritima maritima]